MATKLGDISIHSIEDQKLEGTFSSVYENNVYNPGLTWGAEFLMEAWEHCGEPPGLLADLMKGATGYMDSSVRDKIQAHLASVHFATPNTEASRFVIEARDPKLFEGLSEASWESYYFG